MCNNHHKPKTTQRKGASLKDKKAHSTDHKSWSRRSFLSTLGMAGAGAMMLNNIPVRSIAASPMAALLNSGDSDRVVVILRLQGGLDGLNTIVPISDYGAYQSVRPTLAIEESELFNLGATTTGAEFGLPNYLANSDYSNLEAMWNEGKMSVIQGLGYPNPDYSHFSGQKIISSGDQGGGDLFDTGWMGRYLNNEFPDYINNLPVIPPAIHIGGNIDRMFQTGSSNIAYVIRSLNDLNQLVEGGALYDVSNLPNCLHGHELGFVRNVANATTEYGQLLKDAYDNSSSSVTYPPTVSWFNRMLGEKLNMVARFIKGGLGTKIFMVDVGGFDTHYAQGGELFHLTQDIAESVSVFYQDLAAAGLEDKVLTFTTTEFGRTLHENSGAGTDHGQAWPMLMFGGGLETAGFYGTPPNVTNLSANNANDIPWTTDYRDVYNTVLENWLCVDTSLLSGLMGGTYTTMSGLIVPCSSTGTGTPLTGFRLHAKIFLEGPYLGNGLMEANLTNVLPNMQPFGNEPYYYTGTETISNIPVDMVDWVLVEARSGMPNISGDRATVTVETKVGMLMTNGDILSPSGAALSFTELIDGQSYYFCVRHRNHLDVVTVNSIVAATDMYFDFTTATNQALGPNQQKEYSDGKAVLYAGDYTQDGIIQVTDYDVWKSLPAQVNVYQASDGNLDGIVQVTDYDTWFPNKAKIGISEIDF